MNLERPRNPPRRELVTWLWSSANSNDHNERTTQDPAKQGNWPTPGGSGSRKKAFHHHVGSPGYLFCTETADQGIKSKVLVETPLGAHGGLLTSGQVERIEGSPEVCLWDGPWMGCLCLFSSIGCSFCVCSATVCKHKGEGERYCFCTLAFCPKCDQNCCLVFVLGMRWLGYLLTCPLNMKWEMVVIPSHSVRCKIGTSWPGKHVLQPWAPAAFTCEHLNKITTRNALLLLGTHRMSLWCSFLGSTYMDLWYSFTIRICYHVSRWSHFDVEIFLA